ncbi:thioredoxin domain-containing protein 6-like [Protopterus annectens]|uniref:thioredoxin domain-containing protein 6-like n=1 Tax=Protopterus annectens TaxID=7888 RepID=UPI001CFB2F7D|nr:thioredoxin domain-containing protein 6-like [Protopterus annectens]
MASKKKEQTLQATVVNQEQWEEMLAVKGLTVVDVYQNWCGPCKAVVSLLRKIKNELGDDLLLFAVAEADSVEALDKYRGKCEPTFLFYAGGELVAVVRGANAPLLQKVILEQLQAEKKVLESGAERKVFKDLVALQVSETTVVPQDHLMDDDDDDEGLGLSSKPYTVAIIKPDATAHGKADEIMMKIQEAGFEILAHEERTLTEQEARDFYQHKTEEPNFEDLVKFMSSGPCHVLIISKSDENDDVIPAWREFIGPTDVEVAKKEKPESLRAQYGTETMFNAVHGSDNMDQASKELAFFFPNFQSSSGNETMKQEEKTERTLAIIRPELLKEKKDEVLQQIKEAGFTIAMQKEIVLTEQQVREFYKEHTEQPYFPALLQQMTSGPVLALALAKEDAIQHWRNLLGPADMNEAKNEAPNSLRAQFAVESASVNQLHGASDPEQAKKEMNFFFPVEKTLAVVKPDALQGHKADIMSSIHGAGFSVSQLKETCLDREMAKEFYKEHRGKPFFDSLVDYMCQGPCLMMVLSKENAIQEWRDLMGPTDPEEAKEKAPHSLRAKFAQSILQNAVHGASNQEHAMEKIEFVFGDIESGDNTILQGEEPQLERAEPPTRVRLEELISEDTGDPESELSRGLTEVTSSEPEINNEDTLPEEKTGAEEA